MSGELRARIIGFVFGVCVGVAAAVGEIAAVTEWIPHAGHHGHAPTTLGYIALYCFLVVLSITVWGLIVGLFATVFTD